MPVNGTDGNQFHPDVKQEEEVFVYVNNFARSASFVYGESDFDAYSNDTHNAIEMMNFYINKDLMKKANPDNVKYGTEYDGTINLNTVMMAQTLGTKGHFLEIGDELYSNLPSIVDHDKKEV